MVGGRVSAKQLLTQNINLLYVKQLGNQKRPIYCNNSLAAQQPEGAVVQWLLLTKCLKCAFAAHLLKSNKVSTQQCHRHLHQAEA